ncbi:hypothetical protein A8990_12883 [Paenibacillus taihuensis]|uniref:Uncharacterized protein n=1 Tax=Paenibacillus taihuensis TaxID=1156355 RepID=A0A3D9QX35_9BACL|nr:hypothetical protein [Paenibacillus taihuensis]REE70671.1 hypothetical protein A8990_12883 [Paenibacillus taihuensis]
MSTRRMVVIGFCIAAIVIAVLIVSIVSFGTSDQAPLPKTMNALQQDRALLETYMKSNYRDAYAGAFTEDGHTVMLLTQSSKSVQQEAAIRGKSKMSDKLKISYVKYSYDQLVQGKAKIFQHAEALRIGGVGLDETKNKVNIYISQEELDKHKRAITEIINEDMVNWVIGDIKVQYQAGTGK